MAGEISEDTRSSASHVDAFKERMLEWNNPVEFVNNMYGCHPDEDTEYFDFVYGKDVK